MFNVVEAWWRQGSVNHVTGDVNYLGILMRKQSCIQTVLDCVHLENARGFKYRLLKLLWLDLPEKHCRFITAISECTKQQILKHLPCDPDKIRVIYVALPDGFQPHSKRFHEEQPRVLQLGTAPNKNVPRLIEALTGLPIHLDLIVGSIRSMTSNSNSLASVTLTDATCPMQKCSKPIIAPTSCR